MLPIQSRSLGLAALAVCAGACTLQSGQQTLYPVGGQVTGLSGSVVLENNGVDTLAVAADGTFTFPTQLAAGTPYNVTVNTQPLTQHCTVQNGNGTLNGAVTNVTLTCAAFGPFSIGGALTGFDPSQGNLTLGNGNDRVTVSQNGPFTFARLVYDGTAYNVVVLQQPQNLTCTLNNGSGAVAGGNVTDIAVLCSGTAITPLYSIGGQVVGASGSLTLSLNSSNSNVALPLDLPGSGAFTFGRSVAAGASYAVTITQQPTQQSCVFVGQSDTGTASSNVTSIAVQCSNTAPPTHTLGGTVSGLQRDAAVTLLNHTANSNDIYSTSRLGPYTFLTGLSDGTAYAVSIAAQPTTQWCQVTNRAGTVNGQAVTNVDVTCGAGIVGRATGLNANATVQLSVDGTPTETLVVQPPVAAATDANMWFVSVVPSSGNYNVTLTAAPAGQDCAVANGVGTANVTNITDVRLNCVATLAFSGQQQAVAVLGQANATDNAANRGGSAAQNTVNAPAGSAVLAGAGTLLNPNQALFADTENNRLLIYDNIVGGTPGAAATSIIGQPNAAATSAGTSASTFAAPQGLASDGNTLVVADTQNHRVLIFTGLPSPQEPNAAIVLGQSSFTTANPNCSGGLNGPVGVALVPNGPLLVADTQNHRVLVYTSLPTQSGALPNAVLGQPDLDTCALPANASATSMNMPTGVWSDGQRIVVADAGNNRVLIFNHLPTALGPPADIVVGQPDMASTGSDQLELPTAVASDGVHLIVGQQGQISVYATLPSQSGAVATTQLPLTASGAAPTCWPGPSSCNSVGLALQGHTVLISDGPNNRLLVERGQ